MMAGSTTRSNQRPDTLMQDRICQVDETSCNARPDHTFGSFSSILACPQHVRLGVDLGNADCPVLPIEGIGLDVIQTARDRTLRGSRAEQHDRTMRSLSSGAHSRDPLASPGERCTACPGHERICSLRRPVICPSGGLLTGLSSLISDFPKNISVPTYPKSDLAKNI